MLYILDTDHVSLLQRQHPLVIKSLQQVPLPERAVSVITLAEQMQGRLAAANRAKTETEVGQALQYLMQTAEYYRGIRVLPYDDMAVAEYERLRKAKLRVGTQDLRIAAIALANQATLVTRNQRDFIQIPQLAIIDWTLS